MKIKMMLLLIFIASVSIAQDSVPLNANIVLDKVRKDLTSLSANFEQYEIDANDNHTEKSKGKVWLNAPDQFKWEYMTPIPQLIVANGAQVWVYDADLEQVTIKRQRSKQNPIYVLLNKEHTEKYYTISLQEKAESSKDSVSKVNMQWVKMLPKKPSDEVKVVWLGVENNNLKILKLQNQLDNIVVFEFNQIQRNPELTEGFFTFVIPKGTDIIRDTGLVGEF